MIFASKTTLNLKNLKILRSKVTKNLTNLPKKFCEFPPSSLIRMKEEKLTNKLEIMLFSCAVVITGSRAPSFAHWLEA